MAGFLEQNWLFVTLIMGVVTGLIAYAITKNLRNGGTAFLAAAVFVLVVQQLIPGGGGGGDTTTTASSTGTAASSSSSTTTSAPATTTTLKSTTTSVYSAITEPQVEWIYEETGETGRKTWHIEVSEGGVLIVGGYKVNGKTGGVYKGYPGGQTVDVTVTNGFYTIVPESEGRQEWDARIQEARDNHWTISSMEPLPEWK